VSESLVIQIPGDTDPFDRYDLYEKPLNRALREAGRLGTTTGGGTGMTLGLGGVTVECCHLDLDVKDLRKAVPVIRRALARAKVPAGTLVGHVESDSVLLHFTEAGPEVVTPIDRPLAPPPPRLPWAAGEVVGYRLTPRRWVLLHVVAIDPEAVLVRVPQWRGRSLPPADAIPALVRRRPTKYRLIGSFMLQTSRVTSFPASVRLTPPRVFNLRRTARTGVTVAPGAARGFAYSATVASLDRALRQVFGLAPMDGATRLYNDLGIGPMHHHLAAWDAPPGVTPADARRLFYAHVRSNPVADQPLRGTVPPTENTERFVAALKAHFKGTDVWGWGTFRASEGFVIIPVDADRLAEVWPVAVRLGRAHGVTVYDPQAERVARPRVVTRGVRQARG
jgi:hypothetical protein